MDEFNTKWIDTETIVVHIQLLLTHHMKNDLLHQDRNQSHIVSLKFSNR